MTVNCEAACSNTHEDRNCFCISTPPAPSYIASVSVKVQMEAVCLHPKLEFWPQPSANGDHTKHLDVQDIFYGCKNRPFGH